MAAEDYERTPASFALDRTRRLARRIANEPVGIRSTSYHRMDIERDAFANGPREARLASRPRLGYSSCEMITGHDHASARQGIRRLPDRSPDRSSGHWDRVSVRGRLSSEHDQRFIGRASSRKRIISADSSKNMGIERVETIREAAPHARFAGRHCLRGSRACVPFASHCKTTGAEPSAGKNRTAPTSTCSPCRRSSVATSRNPSSSSN